MARIPNAVGKTARLRSGRHATRPDCPRASVRVCQFGSGRATHPAPPFSNSLAFKSFTAAGVMKLREAGKLRLDDPIDQYVKGLHPQIAEATVSQLLSHSAGIVRDGADAGYFEDRRPFPSTD